MFGTPKPPGSTGPSSAELAGKLLIVKVNGIKTGIETKHGLADALQTDVIDLSTGEKHDDTLLFSRTLTNQLNPGTTYLGRLKKEDLAGGKTAWHFLDASTEAADVETAQKYLAYVAGQSTTAAAPSAAPSPAPFVPQNPAPAAPAAAVPSPPWA